MIDELPIATCVVDLTPETAVPMGGHQGDDRLTKHRYGQLEANILVVGRGTESVVLVSVDTLFVGPDLTRAIVETCYREFGVGPERVMAVASHTHSAPMLDRGKPGLGRTDDGELHRSVDLIIAGLRSVKPQTASSITIGAAVSDLAVNRRLRWRFPTLARLLGKTRDDIYICDNPDGPRDDRIRTAVWCSATGHPLAAFWSFACHPTAFPVPDTASADYIGVVRDSLRQVLGQRVPVIFAPGCMGDVRPRSPKPWLTLARLPGVLIYGPQATAYGLPSWESWAAQLASQVVSAHEDGQIKEVHGTPKANPMVRLPMDTIFEGQGQVPEFHAKSIDVPGLGRLVTLSCEPVSDIGALLGVALSDLVLGYEGDVFGYLPTNAMIKEGGYEARRFMTAFGMAGAFRPDVDQTIARIGRALRGQD